MRLCGVTTAVCVFLLCAAGTVGAWHRAEQLRSEADWLLERSRAQASGYAQSFDDTLARQELETFAQRRVVMEQAAGWQRAQTLGILLTAMMAAVAWVLSLLRRLQGELDEAGEELDGTPAISHPRSA